jgi:Gamma-glutamyl cyclotransferase, AIG2-like
MAALFAYGTLLDERVRDTVFGRPLRGSPDALFGFALSSVALATDATGSVVRYPNVVATGVTSDIVPGVRFDVTDADLSAADAYETSAYGRRVITLASGASAWVYVAIPDR